MVAILLKKKKTKRKKKLTKSKEYPFKFHEKFIGSWSKVIRRSYECTDEKYGLKSHRLSLRISHALRSLNSHSQSFKIQNEKANKIKMKKITIKRGKNPLMQHK